MRIIRIALLLVLLTPLSCPASEFSNLTGGLIDGKAATFDQSQRKALAKHLYDVFKSLDNAVPAPKPSEQEWVDSERRAVASTEDNEVKGKRFAKLSESVEFQQANIKSRARSIMDSLSCVTQTDQIGKEIYCWSMASFYLTDQPTFDDAIAILKKGKRIYITDNLWILDLPKPLLGYGWFYHEWGRGIQEYFVIPYLRGTLTK